jgi:transcriptional regulator with GAF, ATPase, and Fis domain/tetratricopeptide (TPR) repeat protein
MLIARLFAAGWLQPDGEAWKLRRPSDAGALLRALDDAVTQPVAEEIRIGIRSEIDSEGDIGDRSAMRAALVRHEARTGRIESACRHLLQGEADSALRPRAWRSALEALSEHALTLEAGLTVARIYRAVGAPERSLVVLARLLRAHRREPAAAEGWLEAGAAALRLGRSRRAERLLRRALSASLPRDARARAGELVARALIDRGRYAEARERSLEALAETLEPTVVASLHENVGVAAMYLGKSADARHYLAKAAALGHERRDSTAEIRARSYEAILEFRLGNVAAAIDGHRAALAIAEREGLSDFVARAALNLGTSLHQHGQWGDALAAYERGLRIASVLGERSTEITLRFNIANLYAAIGVFDRAAAVLERVSTEVEQASMIHLNGAVAALRGEIALGKADMQAAAAHFESARAIFAREPMEREVVEMDLWLAETSVASGAAERARDRLQATERMLEKLAAPDLVARAACLRATLALARRSPDEAMDAALAAERAADGHRVLQAEAKMVLARACELRGAPTLASEHRTRARALWEGIAMSLAAPLRESFWAHPLRRFAVEATSADAGTSGDGLTRQLQRLLEINRRLNSSLSVDRVLEHAMDAAIDLAGAERGFVVLVTPNSDELDIAVARNIDKERTVRSRTKVSHSIVQQVIASGEALLTTDAQRDDRFMGARSVHALGLKSVAAAPIISPDGVLGAIYLDNRFERGRFQKSDLDVLVALADQVAIALRNARLVAALEQRTHQLEAEKRRVEELYSGQAREIDRLAEEVRTKQEVLEYRYDYASIVGRSGAMQKVLMTLDRIIDSPLDVLIQGESGTGKELVARAIHFNGRRRTQPFVGVNCAALPDALLESELFGHVRGAFTGADRDHVGLLAAARGGTLFLDEVGEMSLPMQAKLLRALQEREVRPLGATDAVPIDIRLVCATNRRLEEEAGAGRFRQDLFYRIGVVILSLPPLSDRMEDVPDLARTILARLGQQAGRSPPSLGRDALAALLRHRWPGNVRELENVLSKAFVLASSPTLRAADLDLGAGALRPEPAAHRAAFEDAERRRIVAALNAARWNVSEVSRRLGIPRNTLYRKLERYGLGPGRPGITSR